MQTLRSLIPVTLLGALYGWGICALLYYWKARIDYLNEKSYYGYKPWDFLTRSVAAGFWRSTVYFTLAGAAVGLIIAAVNLILRP